MSLDLYIKSKTPVLHRGTGVYIRDKGETRELETKQEVLTYFPDVNPDDIEEKTYENNTYFHTNLTHNLTNMADECKVIGNCISKKEGNTVTLYDLLWHPDENLGIKTPNMDYMEDVMKCYRKLLKEDEFFKGFNPSNGWGTYEQLLRRTKEYIKALTSISDDFENYTIYAST